MNILLDESVPRVIKKRLAHLAIRTVQEMGWAGIKNGELLDRAERQFDVLVTADKRLRYQQNFSERKLAVLVLPTNQVPTVIDLLPNIERTLAAIKSGDVVELPLPQAS